MSEYLAAVDDTPLSDEARAGDTVLEGDFDDYEVGDGVVIGSDPIDVGMVSEKGSIILYAPSNMATPPAPPSTRWTPSSSSNPASNARRIRIRIAACPAREPRHRATVTNRRFRR